ncbi:unnamed protein product, partial [Laminaria digitata]
LFPRPHPTTAIDGRRRPYGPTSTAGADLVFGANHHHHHHHRNPNKDCQCPFFSIFSVSSPSPSSQPQQTQPESILQVQPVSILQVRCSITFAACSRRKERGYEVFLPYHEYSEA